jgi:hypothetical protein
MKKWPCLVLLLLAAPLAWAATSLGSTIDDVLKSGADATLPPNLSKVLGLASRGRATPVKQLVFRRGQVVHAFNVDPAHRHEIVLFIADEATRETTAYLMTPTGRLRKAVTYQFGDEPVVILRAHAEKQFTEERDAWLHLRMP